MNFVFELWNNFVQSEVIHYDLPDSTVLFLNLCDSFARIGFKVGLQKLISVNKTQSLALCNEATKRMTRKCGGISLPLDKHDLLIRLLSSHKTQFFFLNLFILACHQHPFVHHRKPWCWVRQIVCVADNNQDHGESVVQRLGVGGQFGWTERWPAR